MSEVLAIAAHSMADDIARMATISQNLANATTPGYKKEIPVSRPFVEYLQAYGMTGPQVFQSTLPAQMAVVDQRAGSLRYTGSPLDVAFDGNGWLELQSPEGPVYTRAGNLQVDARGRLVTPSGLPLAGDIALTTAQPRIDQQGRVYEDDKLVGQLRVVTFEHPEMLQKLGEGLFAAPSPDAGSLAEVRVRQGYLENSNVVTVTEMVNVIETMRHFEANQKLIQSYDGLLDKAIRTLGEF
jgi:flagellar basal-body rod protein FlgG